MNVLGVYQIHFVWGYARSTCTISNWLQSTIVWRVYYWERVNIVCNLLKCTKCTIYRDVRDGWAIGEHKVHDFWDCMKITIYSGVRCARYIRMYKVHNIQRCTKCTILKTEQNAACIWLYNVYDPWYVRDARYTGMFQVYFLQGCTAWTIYRAVCSAHSLKPYIIHNLQKSTISTLVPSSVWDARNTCVWNVLTMYEVHDL